MTRPISLPCFSTGHNRSHRANRQTRRPANGPPDFMPTVRVVPVDPVRSVSADEPDFREVLEQFAAAMPERAGGLREAHRTAAYDQLRVQAHQLKGAGGGFGFPRLSELA